MSSKIAITLRKLNEFHLFQCEIVVNCCMKLYNCCISQMCKLKDVTLLLVLNVFRKIFDLHHIEKLKC